MANEVRAPLDGTIRTVMVEFGVKVELDDELLVIEAMKMENLIYAPRAGTVKDVKVKAGDTVNFGDLLLVIG